MLQQVAQINLFMWCAKYETYAYVLYSPIQLSGPCAGTLTQKIINIVTDAAATSRTSVLETV